MNYVGLSVVCLSVFISKTAGQNFTITPITSSSGLYYENIGEILLSNNKWEFVTSVDYEGYLAFYEYLHIQANELSKFCQTTQSKNCENRLNSIKSALNRIEDTDEIMANILGIKPKRVKRFWAEVGSFLGKHILPLAEKLGGKLINKIFGDMDQKSLEGYNQQIAALQNSQQELMNNVNQQLTMFTADSERKTYQIDWLKKNQNSIENSLKILQAAVSTDSEEKENKIKELQTMLDETKAKIKMQEEIQKKLRSDVDELNNKLISVNAEIKNIQEDVALNKYKIDDLEIQTKLNTISIDFNFLLTQFETEQKKLSDTITNANRGFLDPYVITPLNLIEMLQKIQANLPEGSKFAFYPNVENASKLYNMIKPTVYLFKKKILFMLEMPLVNLKTFSSYKLTSLPVPVTKNKFIFILPREAYFIIDKKDDDYMFISHNDFREFCKEIIKNYYICDQTQEISKVSSTSDCEVMVFLSQNGMSDACDKRIMYLEKPLFFQLQEPKTWIYVIPDSEILTFTCNSNRQPVTLNGTGFIRTSDNCVVRTSDFVLQSVNRFTKPVVSNYSSPVNIKDYTDLSSIENVEVKISQINKKTILPFELDELKEASTSIKDLPTSSTISIQYIILIVCVIIIFILVLILYKRKYLARVSGGKNVAHISKQSEKGESEYL